MWFLTVWPEPIWINVKKSWLLLPQHQSTYPRGPESVSIEIPPFRPHFIKFSKIVFFKVNLASQCLYLEVLLLSKFGSERGGISINADFGPLSYVLWCCGGICQPDTFIQIGSDHNVLKTISSLCRNDDTIFFLKLTELQLVRLPTLKTWNSFTPTSYPPLSKPKKPTHLLFNQSGY